MKYKNWRKEELKEVTRKIGSGSTPRGGSNSYKNEGIPFIRSQNIYNNSFDSSGLVFIDDEQAKKLSNVELEKDDVLLNITGDSVARCTKVPVQYVGGRVNQHVSIIRADKEHLDPNYLKYYLVTPFMQEYMLSLARMGGTRAALTKGMIESFEIPIPPLEEQRVIANILLSFDEKIETNNQISNKLEGIAQAIYKQWFIDFEFPNENGEPYKSSGGKMVESELGMFPVKWGISKLHELLKVKHGYAFKSKDFSDENTNLCILTPGNFHIGGGFKNDKFKYLLQDVSFPNEYILSEDDLIITMTDLSRDGDTLGYPAFVPGGDDFQYLHNQRIGKVLLQEPFSKNYLYYLLCTPSYRAHILGSATGTTVKHTAPNRIEDYKFIRPSKEVLDEFDKIINPFFEIKKKILRENNVLNSVRNILLPKLMSGKIQVPLYK